MTAGGLVGLNWTKVGLKGILACCLKMRLRSLNWTKVGLKDGWGVMQFVRGVGLNWTKVGLKAPWEVLGIRPPERFELD